MKKTIKSLAIAMIAVVCANGASAQSVSATSNATGNIVSPLSITHGNDLAFGNMAVLTGGGTVVLSPAGGRTPSGDVTLPVPTGTVTAASFSIHGEPGDTYHITLPSGTVTLTDGTGGAGHTMGLGTWKSNYSPATTGTLDGTTGDDALTIGATLTVGGSQTPGSYSLVGTGGTGLFSIVISY
jgi:Domain of unknown function (DUF4402)